MQKIVGLLGVKGSGKDTAAQFLVSSRGYRRIGFADALYKEAANAFGVTVEFLNNRDTKETDLPQLALSVCQDRVYAACVEHCLRLGGSLTPEELEAPRSPRFILQFWGTEYRRRGVPGLCEGADSYWLDKVKAVIVDNPDTSFVVTDVRFRNEFNFVREIGGMLARVRRPELEAREALERAKSGRAAHGSETELLDANVDVDLNNPEGQPSVLRDAIFVLDDQMSVTV